MKKTYLALIGASLMLCGLAVPAFAQTAGAAANKPTFFGKVFSYVKTDSTSKAVEQPPIPPNMIVDRTTKDVVDNNATVTTAFKSFKIKESTATNGAEPAAVKLDFVDGNNVSHSLEIPPNMINSVVVDANNNVRFIEVVPNTVKAGAVEGGAVFGIPPNMMIPPNMIEGDQH